MGARGPLKLPAHLRSVPDEHPTGPTAAERTAPGRPVKPRGLPRGTGALWDSIVESLDAAGMLSRVDGPALELALRHFAVARVASESILADGTAQVDAKSGLKVRDPDSQVFRDQSAAFLDYVKVLGLAFGARARISVPKESEGGLDNPFAASGN